MSPEVLIGPAIAIVVSLIGQAVSYGMLRALVANHEKEIAIVRARVDQNVVAHATRDDIARLERRLDTVLAAVLRDHNKE